MYKGLQTWQEHAATSSLSHPISFEQMQTATLHYRKTKADSAAIRKASGSTLGSEMLKKYVYFTLIALFSISPEPFILIDQKVLWERYTQSITDISPASPLCSSPGHKEETSVKTTAFRVPPHTFSSGTCNVLSRAGRPLILMLFSEKFWHSKMSWNSIFFRLERWRAAQILAELSPKGDFTS